MAGCGGSGAKDRGGSVGLEFWVLWFFFFFFFDRCLKEEVGMAKLGMAFCYWFDLILGWILFVGSWWWSWGLPWFGLILILILWVAVILILILIFFFFFLCLKMTLVFN